MKIVFCTTCKNRTQHLKMTLKKNLEDNPKATFVILNYNTSDDLLQYVFSNLSREIESNRLVIYTKLNEPVFKMAHAKNMAHRCGILEGADVLVNLDADNLATPGFEDYIDKSFENNKGMFLFANITKGVVFCNGTPQTRVPRGLSGRLAVTRDAFLKSGGYDESKFEGWGSDDKDLNLRLKMLGYEGYEIPARYLSGVPHNNKIRFKEYPHLAEKEDSYFRIDKSTVTQAVVNNGLSGSGIVYRNLELNKPISLPARVFGIGMHKTATTSLHHAFEILGYSSWHWSSAHAAKAIWQEMNIQGRSSVLEKYLAASDLPIPLLYKHLDIAYPNSKFILTIRGDAGWLEAARRHFRPSANKWQAGWDSDPFTNRVHYLLYGRQDFDAEVFLARYRRHNAEVLEYFKDRSKDLLVMNMDNGAGWKELCPFLDRAIPKVTYPTSNGSLKEGHEI